MAEVYNPRHPEWTVLYRVLFHYFDQFLAEYESRFEKEYGFLRPIIKDVVERYLDCAEERLLMFSCRTRGYAVHSISKDSARRAMPRGLSSGVSGYGKSFS